MDHYIDIRLLANAGIGFNELMGALFQKVHAWIARNAAGRIAVSFPDMKKTPGSCLRVHAGHGDLSAFSAAPWGKTLHLWIDQSPVIPVPGNSKHCVVRRVQSKSAHNRRQRSIRHNWLTPEEAAARIPDSATKPLDLPYLYLPSGSTGQRVRFFIQQRTELSEATAGEFTTYGMSKAGATVPWF